MADGKTRGDRFTSLSHGSHLGAVPAAALTVEQFVAERAGDVKKLFEAVDDVPDARHLRRRARSWRPFGLVRCRASKADADRKVKTRKIPQCTSEEEKSKIPNATRMAATSVGTAQGDVQKLRVRKHWRRPDLLLRAHAWAPTLSSLRTRFLETHFWHAKRAHMENLWGHRLAVRNCSLGTRALVRALSRHCCTHERSYMQLIELFGSESILLDVLGRCGLDRRLLLAKEVRAGSRRARFLMKRCRGECDDEERLIGPALLLWSPKEVVQRCESKGNKEEEPEELPFVVDVQGELMETEPTTAHTKPDDVDMDGPDKECEMSLLLQTGWKIWFWIHPAAVAEAGSIINGVLTSMSTAK